MSMAICETLSRPTNAIIAGDSEAMPGFVNQLFTVGKKATSALTDLEVLRDAEAKIEPEIAGALEDDKMPLDQAGDRLASLRAKRDISTARRLRTRERALLLVVDDLRQARTKAEAERVKARQIALDAERDWKETVKKQFAFRNDADLALRSPPPDGVRLPWRDDGIKTDVAGALGSLLNAIDPDAITERRTRDASFPMASLAPTKLTPMEEGLRVAGLFWPVLTL